MFLNRADVVNDFNLYLNAIVFFMPPYEFNCQLMSAKFALIEGLDWSSIGHNYNLFLSKYMEQKPLPVNKYYNAELNLITVPLIWVRKQGMWDFDNNTPSLPTE